MTKVDVAHDLENQHEHKVKWKEYEDASAEIPLTSCLPIPRIYYKIRWLISRIFLWQVIPFFNGTCLGEILIFFIIPVVFIYLSCENCCRRSYTGFNANIPITLIFILATRNSIVCVLFGIPYERQLQWHKLLPFYALALGIYHGWYSSKYPPRGDNEITGIIIIVIMGSLCTFSFFLIRRYVFEIFLKLHWILFLALIPTLYLHNALMPLYYGCTVWALDILIRLLVILRNKKNTMTVKAFRLPGDVIRLTFKKKNLIYKSGQYVFICIPRISIFEWHPFSISSTPFEEDVTIHIRVLGDWTANLYEYITKHGDRHFQCFLDGPYGKLSVDVENKNRKIFLFLSGGIGITPMQSVCNDLVHQIHRGRQIHKIFFVWSVKDKVMITNILDYDKSYFLKHSPNVLPLSFSPDLIHTELNKGLIDAEFYLTRVRNEAAFNQEGMNPKFQANLKFERPNIEKIFARVHEYAKGINERNVVVLACGPPKMNDDACMQSFLFTKEGIRFHFHSEVFEL